MGAKFDLYIVLYGINQPKNTELFDKILKKTKT